MPHREELHRLVELVPPQELQTAVRFLQFLCGGAPPPAHVLVVDDPDHAPEAPESPEEQEAWRDYEQHLSKVKPLVLDLEDEPTS